MSLQRGEFMTSTARAFCLFALLAATTSLACQGDPKPVDTGPPVMIAYDDMIDDFEDGDGSILERSTRTGYWYTYKDMSGGMLTPDEGAPLFAEVGAPDGVGKVMRFFGGNFKVWGAGMGFQFVKVENDPPLPYDVSRFTGLAFLAKGNVPLRVTLGMPEVLPGSEGGSCIENATLTYCHDAHGMTVRLSNEWHQYKIPFNRLIQEGYGKAAVFDPTKVIAAGFDVGAVKSFDVSLDDIGFYK
jgi:hypothetical protein